jgi:hypothetical protein
LGSIGSITAAPLPCRCATASTPCIPTRCPRERRARNYRASSLRSGWWTQPSPLKAELAKIEPDAEQFLDGIAQAQLPSLIAAYENRIRRLEKWKLEINEKVANCGRPLRSFDETLKTSLDFLANPGNLWASRS